MRVPADQRPDLPHARPPGLLGTVRTFAGGFLLGLVACSNGGDDAFRRSHASIRPGMTLGQAFGAGLADYLEIMGTKNVPGATLPEMQPVAPACARYVLDVSHGQTLRVRVYCGSNDPSALQLAPERTFPTSQALARALDADYPAWTPHLSFRVESPPRRFAGVYDHYRFTTGRDGRIDWVSETVPDATAR